MQKELRLCLCIFRKMRIQSSLLLLGLATLTSVQGDLSDDFLAATPIHPSFKVSEVITPEEDQLKFESLTYFNGTFRPYEDCSYNRTDLQVGDSGVISTPNYPRNYPPRVSCEWYLEGPPGSRLQTTIFDLFVQPWFFTYFDYVMISKTGNFSEVDRLAGDLNRKTPLTLSSEGNKLGIRFKSSALFNFRGMKLKYLVIPAEEQLDEIAPSPFDNVCGLSTLLGPPQLMIPGLPSIPNVPGRPTTTTQPTTVSTTRGSTVETTAAVTEMDATSEPSTDATTEISTDATTEISTDATTEISTDATSDPSVDAESTDVTTDPATDATTEVATTGTEPAITDPTTEPAMDATTERATDATSVSPADADTDTTSPPMDTTTPSDMDTTTAGSTPSEEAYKNDQTDDYIIGPGVANAGSFPWMAALLIDGRSFCGGSLIDDEHILTAAHCTDGANRITVLLGALNIKNKNENRLVFNITKENIYQHPSYNPTTITHDITVIKLPSKVNYTENIRPICLPNQYYVDKTFVGEEVRVSGWGKPYDFSPGISPVLKNTTVHVISNGLCRTFFRSIVTGNLICVGTTIFSSPCRGDSGGPLVVKQIHQQTGQAYFMQVGIVSFGGNSCQRSYPVGFTRVTAFLDFISSVTGNEK